MKLARDEMHVLTGGYALDALASQEREAFERHLQRCGSCEAEVRGLRETAARLAHITADRPPPRMQQRVLAAAYRARQLPPLTASLPARSRLRARRPVLALAAASVAAALAFGVTQFTEHRPDLSIQTVRTTAGGTVTLSINPSQRDAVLTAARLPSLPDGRVYQVWVIGPAGARSAGLLSGKTALVLTGVRAGERVGVTVEPPGGTSRPTTSPIVLVTA